jgi:hypothetical protein
MILPPSVCIYHNGNSRVIDFYKEKYNALLEFSGNWASSAQDATRGRLYEMCYADANWDTLIKLRKYRIRVVRHVSSYQDDQEHVLPECEQFDQNTWLTNVVLNNLCFADEIHTDFVHPSTTNTERAIITTGRTANTHVIDYLAKNKDVTAFECSKSLDQQLIDAGSASLLWRKDKWACLTSIWIARFNGFHHKLVGQDAPVYTAVPPIDEAWIESEWRNLCLSVFDRSLFFKYILAKPLDLITTEYVIETYTSMHEKLPYDKAELIPSYAESQFKYLESDVNLGMDLLYRNVRNHILQGPTVDQIKPTAP